MPVTVIGYLSLDQIICPAGRFENVPGGAAYYCAAGAAVAGASVRLVAKAGEDYPQVALDRLERLGVATQGVERVEGLSRRSRLHDPSGQDRTLPHISEEAWWEATRRLSPPVPNDSGIFVFTAMPPDLLKAQMDARNPDDILIADTSAAYAGTAGAMLLALVPRLYGFAPSREETRLLLPELSDDDALADLALRAPLVLQKRGPEGIALKRRNGDILREPSAATSIVDTTGAGDSVVGVLAAAIAARDGDRDLLRECARVAARTVAGVGIAGLLGR